MSEKQNENLSMEELDQASGGAVGMGTSSGVESSADAHFEDDLEKLRLSRNQ